MTRDISEDDIGSVVDTSQVVPIVYQSWAALPNNQFAVGYDNGYVQLWEAEGKATHRYLKATNRGVNSIAALCETYFVTESRGTLKVWKLDCLEQAASFAIRRKRDLKFVRSLSINTLACCDENGQLEILTFSD